MAGDEPESAVAATDQAAAAPANATSDAAANVDASKAVDATAAGAAGEKEEDPERKKKREEKVSGRRVTFAEKQPNGGKMSHFHNVTESQCAMHELVYAKRVVAHMDSLKHCRALGVWFPGIQRHVRFISCPIRLDSRRLARRRRRKRRRPQRQLLPLRPKHQPGLRYEISFFWQRCCFHSREWSEGFYNALGK